MHSLIISVVIVIIPISGGILIDKLFINRFIIFFLRIICYYIFGFILIYINPLILIKYDLIKI